MLNPDFQGFLIEAKITEAEFRDFILDFQEVNDRCLQEFGLVAS